MYFTFFSLLEGPAGCNFRDDPNKEHSFVFDCGAGVDKTHSIRILQNLGLETWEIVNVLIDCHLNGGHCDCGIVFNASNYIIKEIVEDILVITSLYEFIPGHMEKGDDLNLMMERARQYIPDLQRKKGNN